MSKPQRGRNRRTAPARLPKFLRSNLSDTVKAVVATAVRDLQTLSASAPDAVIPPAMLIQLKTELGCETIEVIDLLRVLMMQAPHVQAHTMRNLSALLRGKQANFDRPLTSSDFPDGHRMHLFASAFWGGVNAWGGASVDRQQRPKGFWLDRRNQVEALQRFAVQRPEASICHASLHEAGLHRLATMLSGAELEVLAIEAGLERQLKREPDQAGRWTKDVVVAAYVELCRRWGVTLTTHALGAIKGEASTLRGHAQRAFGTFGAMVDAAIHANPELQPPTRFVAQDGTRLDSQSEVVVWNAVRAALPDAGIVAHVILPGEMKRSTDIVLDGVVYVEVLMVPVADMADPANEKVAAYAAKWARKVEIHGRLGIIPILFEPLDVFDPVRTAARVAEIAERLSVTPIPAAAPTGKVTRGKGHWTFETLCAAVAEVAATVTTGGGFPTHKQLIAGGYGQAANLLKVGGMRERVASVLGLTVTNQKTIWTREQVVTELAAWCTEHGRYPTAQDLQSCGHAGLASAQARLWIREQEGLRAAVEARVGRVLSRRRAADGVHGSLEQVARLLEPLARSQGEMPTGVEYAKAGLNSAWTAASRTWGIKAVAEFLGVPLSRRRIRHKNRGGQG